MSNRPKKNATLVAPELPDNVVPHPRYGVKIKASGNTLSIQERRALHERVKPGTFWPETAIPARVAADGTGKLLTYVDRLCRCSDCFRPFVFYALEQQHWVETLGFHPDAEAVRCTSCRRSVRKVKERRDRIEDQLRDLKARPGALTRDVLSDKQLEALTVDLLALAAVGAIKKLELLQRLRRAMVDRVESRDVAAFPPLIKRIDKLVGRAPREGLNGSSKASSTGSARTR